jgi:putative transposase
MSLVDAHHARVGVAPACDALGVSRATWYRRRARGEMSGEHSPRDAHPRHPRRIGPDERRRVLDVLCAPEFMDRSPRAIHAVLLDRGQYLCSVRSMYRILGESRAARERRAVRHHGAHGTPHLRATGPDQVWSWDITRLPDAPGGWLSLYVVMDVYSRCVVAWLLARRESGALAAQLVRDAVLGRGIDPGSLTLHADRGGPMRSRPMAEMLADLGVEASHSRPRTSNDNPFSEAHFKTLKHCPTYPAGRGTLDQWQAWCREFFPWYNREHRHGGIAFFAPDDVHAGRHHAMTRARQRTLDAAYAAHPERFVRGRPVARRAPREVWINRPDNQVLLTQAKAAGSLRDPACEPALS